LSKLNQAGYCELLEIGISTLYDWQLRYELGTLENKKTVRKTFPRATPLKEVKEVIELCFEYPEWGGKKISDQLLKEGILYVSPGTAQKIKNRVNDLLLSCGYELELMMRFEVLAPNDLWATDIIQFDWYGKTLYVMLLIDEHSRFVLNWRLSTSPTSGLAVTLVDESMKKYDKPKACKSDNGPQYRKTFESELEKRGIVDLSCPPYWPKYNGKLERLNGDIKELCNRAKSLGTKSIVELIEKKVYEHNFIRPHQALDGVTPHLSYTGRAEDRLKEMDELKRSKLKKCGFECSNDNQKSKPGGILTHIRRDGEIVLSVRSFYEVFFQ